MTLRWFGGPTSNALVYDPNTGLPVPGDVGTVWLNEAGTTPVVGLVDENQAPISTLTADGYGYVQAFGIDTDPVVEKVWVDFTGGTVLIAVECNDRASYRASLTEVEAAIEGKLNASEVGNSVAGLDGEGNVLQHGQPIGDQYATPTQLNDAIASERTRADGAYQPLSGQAQAWAGLRDAVANMGTETLRWYAIGDSITEGTGVTTEQEAWPYKCAALLRNAYPQHDQNADDTVGWVPAFDTSSTKVGVWVPAGTIVTTASFGLRHDTTLAFGAGGKITATVEGTSIDVWYATGSNTSSFGVKVDGGAVVQYGGTTGAVVPSNVAHIDLGGPGIHTIEISKGAADNYIEGITVYNGNEDGGIVQFNAGRHGWNSTSWAGTTAPILAEWAKSLTKLDPHLVTIMLGTNDYSGAIGRLTFGANIKILVDMIRANATGWPSILLIAPYKCDVAAVPAWEQYEHGLALTAADLGVGYLDLRAYMPDAGTTEGDASGFYYDAVHPNAVGASRIAELVAGEILAHAG